LFASTLSFFGASGYVFFVCHWGGAGKKAGGEVPAGSVFGEYHYIIKRGGEKKRKISTGKLFSFFREELRKWLRFNYSSLS
jgi:hypothetical protein